MTLKNRLCRGWYVTVPPTVRNRLRGTRHNLMGLSFDSRLGESPDYEKALAMSQVGNPGLPIPNNS